MAIKTKIDPNKITAGPKSYDLYHLGHVDFFLDEVAMYDRPLTVDEIKEDGGCSVRWRIC